MGPSKKKTRFSSTEFQSPSPECLSGAVENLLPKRSMRQCFFTVDTSLRLTSVDKSLGKLLGERLPEALGTPYYEVFPRISHENVDWIDDAIRSGETKICRGFRFNCFYGGADADICIETQKDEAGKVTGALVMVRLYPFCEHFEEVERCRHLVDVGTASKIFGHSIRNPLHTIKGSLFYLQQRYGEQAEVSELVNLAFDEIARIDDLITRFLGASRLEFTLQVADINSVLKELEPFIALQAKASNVDFRMKYGEVPPVLADPFYMEQALYNIFRNALEAMPRGGVLAVETSSGESSGTKHALIEVADTGCGMSKEQADNLLSGLKRDGERGNGLPITLDIFRRHGGHVSIRSEKEVGTAVSLSVPGITSEGKR